MQQPWSLGQCIKNDIPTNMNSMSNRPEKHLKLFSQKTPHLARFLHTHHPPTKHKSSSYARDGDHTSLFPGIIIQIIVERIESASIHERNIQAVLNVFKEQQVWKQGMGIFSII